AAGAIALIADLLVILAIGALCLLDGAFDVFARHRLPASSLNGKTQPRIERWVRRAELSGDGDFPRQFGEDLRARRVALTLAVHDIFGMRMAGHADIPLIDVEIRSRLIV